MIYFFVADLYSRENVVKDLYSRKNILDKMLQYNESGIELSDNNVRSVQSCSRNKKIATEPRAGCDELCSYNFFNTSIS